MLHRFHQTLLVALLGLGSAVFLLSALLHGALVSQTLPATSPGTPVDTLAAQWSSSGPVPRDGLPRGPAARLIEGLSLPAFGFVTKSVAVQTGTEDVHSLRVGLIDGPAFSMLGVGLQAGRTFQSHAFGTDGPPLREAVVSHDFWVSRLASNPGVLGSTIRLGLHGSSPAQGRFVEFTIVGVADPDFAGLDLTSPQSMWMSWNDWPDVAFPAHQRDDFEEESWLRVAVASGGAGTAMLERMNELAAGDPTWGHHGVRFYSVPGFGLPPSLVRNLGQALRISMLLGSLLFLLLFVILTLDRILVMTRTAHDHSIRRALGETGGSIFRREAMRSVRLILMGSLLALACLGLIQHRVSSFEIGVAVEPVLRLVAWPSALGYWLSTTVALALFAALVPQLMARHLWAGPITHLQRSDHRTLRSCWTAATIGAAAMSLAIILAFASALELQRATHRDFGFDARQLAIFQVADRPGRSQLDQKRFQARPVDSEAAALAAFFESVGVDAGDYALASSAPLGMTSTKVARPSGQNRTGALGGGFAQTVVNDVSPHFFDFLRVPSIRGERRFDRGADEIVVNRAWAEQNFGTVDIIGSSVEIIDPFMAMVSGVDPVAYRIIGVVDDAHYVDPALGPTPAIFRKLTHSSGFFVLMVRHPDAAALGAGLDRALADIWPDLQFHYTGSAAEAALSLMKLRHAWHRALLALAWMVAIFSSVATLLFVSQVVELRRVDLAVMRIHGANRRRLMLATLASGRWPFLIGATVLVFASLLVLRGLWPGVDAATLAYSIMAGMGVCVTLFVVLSALSTITLSDARLFHALRARGY